MDRKAAAVQYAPVQQQMDDKPWPSQDDIKTWSWRLEQKEAQLHESLKCLQQQERVLAPQLPSSPDGTAASTHSSPGQSSLQQEHQLLLTMWHCLLEEKRQLTAAMKLAAGNMKDFEPGETPMRDVTCAVITHQLDTPCLSCCFQR